MHENIILEIKDGFATLTINRPEKMNAVNNATVEELSTPSDRCWLPFKPPRESLSNEPKLRSPP